MQRTGVLGRRNPSSHFPPSSPTPSSSSSTPLSHSVSHAPSSMKTSLHRVRWFRGFFLLCLVCNTMCHPHPHPYFSYPQLGVHHPSHPSIQTKTSQSSPTSSPTSTSLSSDSRRSRRHLPHESIIPSSSHSSSLLLQSSSSLTDSSTYSTFSFPSSSPSMSLSAPAPPTSVASSSHVSASLSSHHSVEEVSSLDLQLMHSPLNHQVPSGPKGSGPGLDYLFQDRHRADPLFDETTSTNVTTASGKTVYLPCRVRHLGDRTISWIRKSDLRVLTVGKFTYTSDERFKAVHMDNTDDWSLQIRFPQRRDADNYICQISVSSAKIAEGPIVYINSGTSLQLTCLVTDTPGPPDYIFWHHNGEVISFDSHRGIRVQTEKAAQTTSKLIIEKAHPTDSGNYSCVVTPYDFAEAAHVAVHVLPNGGLPAAIQHGKRSSGEFSTGSSSTPWIHAPHCIILFIGLMSMALASMISTLDSRGIHLR